MPEDEKEVTPGEMRRRHDELAKAYLDSRLGLPVKLPRVIEEILESMPPPKESDERDERDEKQYWVRIYRAGHDRTHGPFSSKLLAEAVVASLLVEGTYPDHWISVTERSKGNDDDH